MTTPAFTATQDIGNFIDGVRSSLAANRKQAVYNPATGAVARQVVLSSAQEVNDAVASARRAFPAWADMPPIRRARIMNKFLQLMNEHTDTLAAMITAEHGKVFSDAQGEVGREAFGEFEPDAGFPTFFVLAAPLKPQQIHLVGRKRILNC